MFVDDVEVREEGEMARISATLGSQETWFELPSEHFRGSVGDALTCLAMFPAMTGATTEVQVPEQYPVSQRLFDSLPLQQATFQTWSKKLQPVTYRVRRSEGTSSDDRVVSSFSGGVDSLYTALRHNNEITHFVYIHGYELKLEDDPDGQGLARLHRAAERLGKELIVVKTNALTVFSSFRIQRLLIYGTFMAAVAHLLGPRRFLVPSSAPLNYLEPSGSHPMTDPRWSTETVEILYDGDERFRLDKMKCIDEAGMLDDIVVCHYNFEANCCRCAKCIRTMMGIELQGLTRSAFSEPLTTAAVRRFEINNSPDGPPFGEYLDLARKSGNKKWVRAMAYAEILYRLKAILKSLMGLVDDLVTGGRLMSSRASRMAQDDGWFKVEVP